jgi:hypothetical protein
MQGQRERTKAHILLEEKSTQSEKKREKNCFRFDGLTTQLQI